MFDVTNRKSFESCPSLIECLRNEKFSGYVIGIGSKKDLVEERKVETEEAKNFFSSLDIPYYEISCLTGEGVNEMYEDVMKLYATGAKTGHPFDTDN